MANSVHLRHEIISRIKPIIESWTEDDIYAISVFVYDMDDNPSKPTFTLGFNTERFYEQYNPDGYAAEDDDGDETRWNYAFWPQNQELIFGQGETEDIVSRWVSDLERAEEATDNFVNILVEVVKDLHKSGLIKAKFGKAIPVLIHELEYYDKIALQNIEANTLPLVKGFAEFCGYFPE